MSNALSLQWRAQAACRDADPDLFFPIGSSGPAVTQTEEAKSICRACPVQAACLEWALKSGQDHGIWGGLDEHERAATRRHPEAPVVERPAAAAPRPTTESQPGGRTSSLAAPSTPGAATANGRAPSP